MLLSIHSIYEFSRGCEIIMSTLQWRHKDRKVHFNWYCKLCTHLGEIAPLAIYMIHLNIVGTIALTRICTIYVHLKETRATDPFILLIIF